MKTNSSAKKRFKISNSGHIKRKHAYKSHILTKKSKKRKRHITHAAAIHPSNMKRVRAMLAI